MMNSAVFTSVKGSFICFNLLRACETPVTSGESKEDSAVCYGTDSRDVTWARREPVQLGTLGSCPLSP